MLNANDWWQVMIHYAEAIFPLQWVLYALGLGVVAAFLLLPRKTGSRVVNLYLGLTHVWIGVFFFVVLGKGFHPPMNYSQGFLFVSLGVLFLLDAFREQPRYRLPNKPVWRGLWLALVGVVFLYPLVGLVQGRPVTEWIFPGTYPCPTAALALAFLIPSLPKQNKWAHILLLVWAIPFPPMVQIPQYGVYEDMILFGMGLISMGVWLAWRIKTGSQRRIEGR